MGCYFAYAPCLPMLQQVMTPVRRKAAFYTGLVLWAILCLMTYDRKLSVNKVIRVVLTIILSIATLMILVFRFLGPYTYFGVSLGGGFDSCQGPQQQQQQPQQQLQGGDQDSNTGTDKQQQVAPSTQQNQSAGKNKQQRTKQQQQKNQKQNSNQQKNQKQKQQSAKK